MQVTFQPLPLLSRVAAALVVALPFAALRVAVDDFERQAIGNMSHQELIAFVRGKKRDRESFLDLDCP
jgi:hypothetical protein